MKTPRKKSFPLHEVRRYLEPGPIVLVSSAHKGEQNIMTMGWHLMMEFSPALFGCIISSANHSFEMLKKSRECVINLPTVDMIDTVVRIGNSTGGELASGLDKFAEFGLTPVAGKKVGAPLIAECHANFECKLADTSQIRKYGLFIWEIVAAHVATSPKHPETVHYLGKGEFMVAGKVISRRKWFRRENL